MARSNRINYKALRNALTLVGVYCLHLFFFQVLMQAGPAHNSKPLFIHNEKKQSKLPPNRPAVTYYSIMMKQGKEGGGRDFENVAPVTNHFEVAVPAMQPALAVNFYPCQPVVTGHNMADATFKRYCLLGVFLI